MRAKVDLLRARLSADSSGAPVGLFEAAVMFMYVTGSHTRTSRPAGRNVAMMPSGPTIAEFDSREPANRFRAAVRMHLDERARLDVAGRGIRHQHWTYSVCAGGVAPQRVAAALNEAWHCGVRILTDLRPISPTSPRSRQRQDLALAAWRGLILAGRPVQAKEGLRLRLPNTELASIAVRAARLLEVPAKMRHQPPLPVVGIDDTFTALELLSRVAPSSIPS